jgi:hypothetical protein
MAFTFRAGRPLTLNEDMIAYLCSFVHGNHSVKQVSRLSGVANSTIDEWLTRGETDRKIGKDSIHAQFSEEFDRAIGKEVNYFLTYMANMGSYQSVSWMLEKCYAEDYGHEAPQMKELRELFKLSQEMKGLSNGSEKAKASHSEAKETQV